MKEDPMSSNKIRLHPIMLSKPRITWPRIFIIMSCQTHGLLTTHQALILSIINCGAGVVEKEVNRHLHKAKSSMIETIFRGMRTSKGPPDLGLEWTRIGRIIWNFFRLENEHLNNCGNFRAVRDIGIAPIRKVSSDPVENVGQEGDKAATYGMFNQLLTYTRNNANTIIQNTNTNVCDGNSGSNDEDSNNQISDGDNGVDSLNATLAEYATILRQNNHKSLWNHLRETYFQQKKEKRRRVELDKIVGMEEALRAARRDVQKTLVKVKGKVITGHFVVPVFFRNKMKVTLRTQEVLRSSPSEIRLTIMFGSSKAWAEEIVKRLEKAILNLLNPLLNKILH
ncbi:hypothetical protein ACTXT7_001462 [Hymenolepis weldensis]